METLIFSQTLTTCNCASCGIMFGIPSDYHQRLRDKGDTFYCPSGHLNVYSESTVAKLQKEVDSAKRTATYWREQADTRAQQRDAAHRQRNAFKGVVTKVKKRIGNGVCPCCSRTFKQLAAHMASKHPDYAGAE